MKTSSYLITFRGRLLRLTLISSLLAGCATPKIDWAGRVGAYTHDQAVMDFGPPDKQARLDDGTQVSEWLTRRGYSYVYSPAGYYGYDRWWYSGPLYPSYVDTTPDRFLRLTFGPDGRLKAWKTFYK